MCIELLELLEHLEHLDILPGPSGPMPDRSTFWKFQTDQSRTVVRSNFENRISRNCGCDYDFSLKIVVIFQNSSTEEVSYEAKRLLIGIVE